MNDNQLDKEPIEELAEAEEAPVSDVSEPEAQGETDAAGPEHAAGPIVTEPESVVNSDEPKPENRKGRKALKIILLTVLFIALAAAAFFAATGVKYVMLESEVNSTEPESREGQFYFNSLSYRDQLLYDNVLTAARAVDERSEVLPHSYDIDTFSKVVKYVMADNPDLFYVDFDGLVINHSRHKTYVTMDYRATGGELEKMRAEYDAAIENCLRSTELMNDLNREVAVHDAIIDRCVYAVGEADRLHNTAYGALVLGKAYCDGYAYAAKAMFDRLGIQSAIVYGSVNEAEHVWNLVNIGGRFTHLDIMWDDADLSYGDGLRFHGYFNLGENEILRDHSYDYDELLPEAESGRDYYTMMGLRAATAEETEEIIYDSLIAAKGEKLPYIELYCDETNDNELLAPHFKNAVTRANAELGEEVFMSAFRVFPASDRSNAITIQIFYTSSAMPEDTTEENGN